ncbi:MAG TPA: MBL fold metallo-hydrolase [Pyrinomonadaceae bacterium]|nr:MBL fold metallo-hydrolase [Pyrinomonadaceae bacterium]
MPTNKTRRRPAAGSVDLTDDSATSGETVDASQSFKVWLLDVGPDEYGDAVLCRFGNKTVLIDGAHPGDAEGKGGHPSIPDQIGELLDQEPPYHVSLIIISHAHQDHIGCLPALIKDNVLRADWALLVDPQLGWGRAADDDRDAAITDDRVRILAAALREEVRSDRTDDATLEQFLSDAATLEDRYNDMIETLRSRGTRIVRHGRDSGASLTAAFADVGLKIIGPSRNHMLECADVINGESNDAIQMASDAVRQDATGDVVEVYRRLVGGAPDALDVSRPGPGVNLQSIITRFLFRGHRLLFAGDMQFEKPQVNNDFLKQSVLRLRQKIANEAPYSLVKLSHHGSDNAFSEVMLQELGTTKNYGICAGEFSKHHPHVKVLSFLNDHRDDIKWARTDHNGLVAYTFSTQGVRVKQTTGEINDPQPNSSDISVGGGGAEETLVVGTGTPTGESVIIPPAAEGGAAGSQSVEVHAKIPHVNTRVTITVDVQPGGGSEEVASSGTSSGTTVTPSDAFRIAGGRQLPELLFVTNRETLAANIGATECARVLASIRSSQQQLLDNLPPNLSVGSAAELVRRRLAQRPNVKGVVLVGGYDVVPALSLKCLTADLERRLAANDDPDGFVVWSDDIYGVRGSSGRLELPVSRIPDGKSAQLVSAALQAARGQVAAARAGVRNVARPFADQVFRVLPGTGNLHISKPATFNQQTPSLDLKSERVYFMLHGDYIDSSRFWGEGTANHTEAVNISNVPQQFKGVVFTGCCWGGLTVDTPAGRVTPGRPFGQKTVGSSIALSFLAQGALAFIGCTGAHYSPLESPYNYFGGPMHTSFWRHYNAGAAPALALFNAKSEYHRGIPHGRSGATSMAIENKILRQYTCLGLGW